MLKNQELVRDFSFTVPQDGSVDGAFVNACSAAYIEHGAIVLNKVFSPTYLEMVNRAYEAKYAGMQDKNREVGDKRTMIAIEIEPPFDQQSLFAPPAVMGVIRRLLGNDCILDAYVAVTSRPESQDQHVHIDFPPLFDEDPGAVQCLLPYAVTLAIPLIPVTAMTGVTRFWPGSHKSGSHQEISERDLMQSVSIVPDYGGCYLFDARVVHGGTANYSDRERPIIYIVYSRPWWRDSTNFYNQKPLLIRPEVLAKMPSELQSMFRYAG